MTSYEKKHLSTPNTSNPFEVYQILVWLIQRSALPNFFIQLSKRLSFERPIQIGNPEVTQMLIILISVLIFEPVAPFTSYYAL